MISGLHGERLDKVVRWDAFFLFLNRKFLCGKVEHKKYTEREQGKAI